MGIRLKRVYADTCIDQVDYDLLEKEVKRRNSCLKEGSTKWTVKSLLSVWLYVGIENELRELKKSNTQTAEEL